jgi:hypothetical protein
MLIPRQNSHPPRGEQRTGRREAQSREFVKRVKVFPARKAVHGI